MSDQMTTSVDYGAKLDMSTAKDEEHHPLLISHKQNAESQLSNQQTVINLDNKKIRLTIWCMVYVIYAGIRAVNYSAEYLYWTDAHNSDSQYWWEAEDHMEYYSYLISSNTILWLAAAFVLCNLYCVFCQNQSVNYLCALLFVVGWILNVVSVSKGVNMYCGGEFDFFADEGWCRVNFVMSHIFLWLFSTYMAVDIVYAIGNDIRNRIFISALCVCVYSSLQFAFWVWQLDYVTDPTLFNGNASFEFIFRSMAAGNMLNAIVCIFIMVCIVFGDSDVFKSVMSMLGSIPVAKILGFLLIIGTSFGFLAGWLIGAPAVYNEVVSGMSLTLTIPAIGLLIYDSQYKFQ